MADTQEVIYGASKVKLNKRKDGRFSLRWRESGKWRYSTAKDKSRARIKAREIAKRLDANTGIKRVSMEESRAIELLKEKLGKRTLLDVASGVRQLLQVLPSNVSLSDIAREWESRANSNRWKWRLL